MFYGYSEYTSWGGVVHPRFKDLTVHHVFVTKDGDEWGCFGDDYTESIKKGRKSEIICKGLANYEWVKEIAGPDRCAGLENLVTGVCHHVANRLLIVADGDVNVKDAPGNELAIPLFGKYGLELPAFIKRIEETANIVNSRYPNPVITKEKIDAVISKVQHSSEDEMEISKEDIAVHLGTTVANLPPSIATKLLRLYEEMRVYRNKAYADFKNNVFSPDKKINREIYGDKLVNKIGDAWDEIKRIKGTD